MAPRLELQTLLESFTEHVYFQPPPNIEMQFPCIRYMRLNSVTEFAENRPYVRTKQYQVMVIDRNPDSVLPDQVEALPLCSFDRFYTADNLNHFVFNLFF